MQPGKCLIILILVQTLTKGQVTSSLSSNNMKILPNSYSQFSMISQDIMTSFNIDNTAISIEYVIESSNSNDTTQKFTIIEINDQTDYECYQ